MKGLVLLVLAGLVTANDLELGDRIVATEQECQRIYKLNEYWGTNAFHEEAAQYVDLFFICVDSLNEDKYKYIDDNRVDMSLYPGEKDKIPVETSNGKAFVSKPPPRKTKDEESMREKLSEYLAKTGGMMNPLYRITSIQSEMGQEIVDGQVECETLALYVLRHPEDKESESQHVQCINKLNCIKEKFMKQHRFSRHHYSRFFPILYKRRGTMIKTPPKLEKSVCETPGSAVESKGELDKWLRGVEYIGGKLTDFGEAGTDFIQNLVKKGMGGGDKILTRKELDDLMSDAESVTIADDDEEDDENDDENTYKVYGDVMIEKLAELEAKGIEIAHTQLEKAKPAIGKVQNIASLTGEKLKALEELKLKPVVEKTAHGLSNAESNIKIKTKNAFEDVKGGLTIAGSVAKMATAKAKGEGSILMNKLKSNALENLNDREDTSIRGDVENGGNSKGVLDNLIDRMIQPEYLPEHNEDFQAPSLLKIVKDMGGHGEGEKDKESEDELKKTLKSLKESTRKRAKDLNLSKEEIKQSADVVKDVMHALLTAASRGYGSAKDMSPQEIDKARSVVDELVNYATSEILNEDVKTSGEEVEEEDNDEDDEEYTRFASDLADDDVPQKQETNTTTIDQVTGKENNTTPIAAKETDQTATDEVEEIKSGVEGEVDERQQGGDAIPEEKKDIPNLK